LRRRDLVAGLRRKAVDRTEEGLSKIGEVMTDG
jgi:hypothetical protein